MKFWIKIILLILAPYFVSGQQKQSQLNSLHQALNSAANDTARMDVFSKLGSYYLNSNIDSSKFFLEQSLTISRRLGLKLNEVILLHQVGFAFLYLGNYPKSFESLLDAINISNDPASEENTWNLPRGYTPHTERLDQQGWSYYNLGVFYYFTGNLVDNLDKQIKNFREAEKFAEIAADSNLLAYVNLSLGFSAASSDKPDSALLFEQKALSYFSHSSNKAWEGETWKYLGDAYSQKGNKNSALDALFKAIKIDSETNNMPNLGWAYNSLGDLYSGTEQQDSVIYYARMGLNVLKSAREAKGVSHAYHLLFSAFNKLNNRDSAFIYLQLASTTSDSLHDADRKNLLAFQDVAYNEQVRVANLEKGRIETKNKMRTYAFLSAIAVFILIALLLYRNNRHRKRTNELLQKQKEKIEKQKSDVEKAFAELKSTQAQLIQSEKMASLGELTAGIAHEIQNPLNFVNNFSEVNKEMADELQAELKSGNVEEAITILNDIKENSEKINHHGKRADAIVKNMLQHSRQTKGVKEPTDINALCDEYLRLSYHGMRAKDKSFNADFKTDFDESIGKINIVPQDIGRSLLNLINNAFYAVNERSMMRGESYKPEVIVSTKKDENQVYITVSDNGNGIPDSIKQKIFQPFFTTKPTGQGTGLGLSLSYDIIKAHGGEIKVVTKEGEGSEFIIQLPVYVNTM
jgi:two-component system, NtrC family, sensor kinase